MITATGHQNVLSLHRNTLEFTKDSHLTKRGDCIVAVNADRIPPAMEGKIEISIEVNGRIERITALANPLFSHQHEMVIRKTAFIDSRTFATHSDKAACDIDRSLVRELTNPLSKAKIEIRRL